MINKLYFRLLLVIAVIAPLYWLTLTTDGQKRVDSVILQIAGDESIDLNFEVLDARFTESHIKEVYPEIDWDCVDVPPSPGQLGDRQCQSVIGSFNGIPSREITLYFRSPAISAVKLDYRRHYHEALLDQLTSQLGPFQANTGFAADPDAVMQWQTPGGLVLMKRELKEGDAVSLMWLAGMQMKTLDNH